MRVDELETKLELAGKESEAGNFDLAEQFANDVIKELDQPLEGDTKMKADQIRARAVYRLAEINFKLGHFDSALEKSYQVLTIAESHNLTELQSKAWNNIGNVFNARGAYDKALDYFHRALDQYQKLGDKLGISKVTGNIGLIYQSIGDNDKALEYYKSALNGLQELGNKSSIAIVTGNIGGVYYHIGDYKKALEYFQLALIEHQELGEKLNIGRDYGNIGAAYVQLDEYEKALEYYNKALNVYRELGEKFNLEWITGSIGGLYANTKSGIYDPRKAEEFLVRAINLSREVGSKSHLVAHYKGISDLYENEKRYAESLGHFKKYVEMKEEINLEEVKKQEAIRQQQKETEIAKATANAKLQATEELLHNVLPPIIADRMISGEKLIAEKLSNVSVLFADIVKFTELSRNISAEELVAGLDNMFTVFDSLAEKYGLEKIKTIGDSYMVVSGAPEPRADHAEAMASFAIEMVDAMKSFKSITSGEQIELRIGIHCGDAVAGVIGKKKFAYDLWGDSVNTASRMESHSEAGKVHVSEDFRNALKNSSFNFTERGEMEVKGKGMMKTYFLEN